MGKKLKQERAQEWSFERTVDLWVRNALAAGARTFPELLLRLPSVYPSEALAALKRVASDDLALSPVLKSARARTEQNFGRFAEIKSSLPEPHPLDYDWRFGREAISRLLRECEALSRPGNTVAMFGAPSLFEAAIERHWGRKQLLLDACQPVTEVFNGNQTAGIALDIDLLRDPLPELHAQVIVLDPPWYREYFRAFSWAAQRVCCLGGHVLLSFPPAGTRPGVEIECEANLSWAESLGFRLVRFERDALPYAMPRFERNALVADAVYNVPLEWRRADLGVLVLERRTAVPRPVVRDRREKWIEECVSAIRFKIRSKGAANTFDDPSLITAVEGDVLPSVSRRDARRGRADIWTPGNRIYRCRGTDIFGYLLQAARRGEAPRKIIEERLDRALSDTERRCVARASRQVQRLTEVELREQSRGEQCGPIAAAIS